MSGSESRRSFGLSDRGKSVPESHVAEILDHGTPPLATGVMVFVWGTVHPQRGNFEKMGQLYRTIRDRRWTTEAPLIPMT